MSGVGNGENAHAWADVLLEAEGLEVRFSPTLPPHAQRLMATLGVRVVFDQAREHRCPDGCQDPGKRHGR